MAKLKFPKTLTVVIDGDDGEEWFYTPTNPETDDLSGFDGQSVAEYQLVGIGKVKVTTTVEIEKK